MIQVLQNQQELDPKGGFRDHAEYLVAVAAARPGHVDPRLVPLAVNDLHSDPGLGFMVPQGVAPRTLIADEIDPVSARTQPVVMRDPVVSIPARVDKNHATSVSGGLSFTRRVDATPSAGYPPEPTPSRVALEAIELGSDELWGITHVSDRVLVAASPESFLAMLSACARTERADTLLEERYRGDGMGRFSGVLKSGALITVTKEIGQAASTVVGENLLNIRRRMWNYSNAIWLIQPDSLPQVVKATVTVGAGGSALPVWRPGDKASGSPDMILGRPAFFHEVASAIGEVGDVLCGDWSQYLDAVYTPLKRASSIHVRFSSVESTFRFYERGDGASWWRAPVTPRRSSLTKSPFVTLEDRA